MYLTFKRLTVTLLLLLASLNNGFTQSLDRVKTMYNEGNYAEAKPGMERLVKQSPNNSSYNLWYGVCCYETKDYADAEKYLIVANKRKVVDSYRYLALLYTELYRFGEAAEMWDDYITLQKKQKNDTAEAEKKLEQARNLNRMLEKTEDVQIIDSMVIAKDAFLKTYILSDENGTLVGYNDFFKDANPVSSTDFANRNGSVSSTDFANRNGPVSSTVFTNQKGSVIYYARPAENGVYTLFSQSKLLDVWGDEKALLPNQTKDNNYPFVLSDGITLYFASKGNESIGGYDIFVTRYNTNTNSYLTPEQMGMPFNSPANDYMMVIDESKGVGWFVSDRYQPEDKVCVYLFIPDPSRKRLDETTDNETFRRRAALVSIRDSWQANANYSTLIRLAQTEQTQKEIKKARDFEFFVNDKTTYYSLNEIKSAEAKTLYGEVIKLNKQIENLKSRLDELRASYIKAPSATREQLKPTILQAENQLYTLLESVVEQEKKARNAEIGQLKK